MRCSLPIPQEVGSSSTNIFRKIKKVLELMLTHHAIVRHYDTPSHQEMESAYFIEMAPTCEKY